MKRRFEETTKASFDDLLKRLLPTKTIVWEEVPQAHEPPDWYLQVGTDRYAVEATSISRHYSTQTGEKPENSIIATLNRFVKEIEVTAIKEGSLSGGYIISLCTIPNFSKVKGKIREKILNYIQCTRNVSVADCCNVWEANDWPIKIQKIKGQPNFVEFTFSGDPMLECEIKERLFKLLATSIEAKKERLKHILEPIILLVLDAFDLADDKLWNQAVLEIPAREAFHAICRIAPPEPAMILWSARRDWQPI